MRAARQRLKEALEGASTKTVLVVTGAGISHASGIPTFRGRDPGAIWKRDDVELATASYFLEDPVGQWSWYLDRFSHLDGARPNPAHFALAALESWCEARGGELRVVTQNIDTLHEEAGSRRLIKVHGSSDRVRCSRDGCELGAPRGSLPRAEVDLERFRAAPSVELLPRCPRCGEPLRAHVLFFDEFYQGHEDYRFHEVTASAATAALVLFVGTSFSVGVTELVLTAAHRRSVAVFSIDPNSVSLPPWYQVEVLGEPAEKVLPALCADVGAALELPADQPA